MEGYHKLVPRSDPMEDWEDRNILYSMYEPYSQPQSPILNFVIAQ